MNRWRCNLLIAFGSSLWFVAGACDPDAAPPNIAPAAAGPTTTTSTGRSGGAGGVAVVDLEKVGKEMGWNDRLQQDVRAADAALRRQLDERVAMLRKAVEEKKKLVAAAATLTREQLQQLNAIRDVRDLEALPLSDEQRQDLINVLGAAQQDGAAAQNNYQLAVRQRQAELINGYREVVRPVAGKIAAEGGLAVVLTPNDTVLYYDPAVDITDKVIEALKKLPTPPTPDGSAASQTTPPETGSGE